MTRPWPSRSPRSISGLAGTTSNVEQISGRLNRGEGTAGKLLTDQQLYDRFNNVSNRLEQIVSGVEAGARHRGPTAERPALV
jgi:hypothetical protein